ncbi:hypothetical protein M8J75_007779 [Diaphorina citri]|nr:hypothetical protein M8J75_007779 [Diaphorina citri]
MRSHWETSEKSIYVRTVWINGVRHAILSKNDPLAGAVPKRPYSCGNLPAKRNKRPSAYQRSVSISTATSDSRQSEGPDGEESISDIEYRDEGDGKERGYAVENCGKGAHKKIKLPNLGTKPPRSNYERHFSEGRFPESPNLGSKPGTNFESNFSESHFSEGHSYNYFLKSNFINPITERVLNWLDLANKDTGTVLYPDNSVDMGSVGPQMGSLGPQMGSIGPQMGSIGPQMGSIGEEGKGHSSTVRRVSADAVQNPTYIVSSNECYSGNDRISSVNERFGHGNDRSSHGNDRSKGNVKRNNAFHPLDSNSPIANQPSSRVTRNSGERSIAERHESKRSANPAEKPTPPNTANFMFDFHQNGSNVSNRCNVSNVSNRCGESTKGNHAIRHNNEMIRRNNENISRLVRNIDTFRRTNEIVLTSRPGTDRNNNEKANVEDKRLGDFNSGRNQNDPNNKSSSKGLELSKGSELGVKKHRKGHRKAKSSSRRNDKPMDQSEDELECSEDINDTFRYVIMMRKETDTALTNRLNEYSNRIGEFSTNRNSEYSINRTNDYSNKINEYSINRTGDYSRNQRLINDHSTHRTNEKILEYSNRIDENPRPGKSHQYTTTEGNEPSRRFTTIDEPSRRFTTIDEPSRRFTTMDEPWGQPMYGAANGGRPYTAASKPQLHIFMPRFQNIS